jgi:hypothetical protein
VEDAVAWFMERFRAGDGSVSNPTNRMEPFDVIIMDAL